MKSKVKISSIEALHSLNNVELGSGNVFKDLGLSDPEDRQLRVQLATRLIVLLDDANMTQAAAAKRLGISQPHVSELKNYKLGRFASERLLHLITLMDRDVEIFIRPRAAAGSIRSIAGAVTVWATA